MSFCKLGFLWVLIGGGVLEDWGFMKEEVQDLVEVLGNLVGVYSDRMYVSLMDFD